MILQIISQKKRDFTTLLTLLVFIEHYLETLTNGRPYEGLTILETNRRYNVLLAGFGGTKAFYAAYVERKAKATGYFYEDNESYFLRRELVAHLSIDEITNIRDTIRNLVRDLTESHEDLMREIGEVELQSDPAVLSQYIVTLLSQQRLRNFGQQFEVISFSILKVYFETLGFALKRFSTSFANDGGMDFLSSQGIYQVTTSPSKGKIDSDLQKLPGISRVLVVPEINDKLTGALAGSELITNVITTGDLKDHFLAWMLQKERIKTGLMKKVIETLKYELGRESVTNNHANTTEDV